MDWMNLLVDIAKPIVLAIITLIIGLAVIKAVVKVIGSQIEKSKLDDSLKPFLQSVISAVLKVLLVISVVGILGIPIASFVAILGAAGLAIGLAFQGSLANLAGGVLLLTIRPFKVGDYIEGAGYSGTVKAIQILYTELVTADNKMIFIPNGNLSNAGITNYSVNSTRRVDFTFGVSYDADNQHVLQVLRTIITNHELVMQDPEPFVRLANHGDSSVDYAVKAWVKAEDYWTVYYDVLEEVKVTFDRENIGIPYPTMDINMSNE